VPKNHDDGDDVSRAPTLDATSAAGSAYLLLEELSSGPRYTRSSLHASGGMGHVWLARDVSIGRDVALKELRAEAAAGPAALRFVREAKITGQLEHPGVVPVYELGRDPHSGRPFYTMRFIRGRTLSDVAAAFHHKRRPGWHEPMELVALLTAFVSVCNTIAYAHSHGIVHRDLKGENIVLGEFGEVIVLDWGLAKRLDGSEEEPASAGPDAGPSRAPGQTMMGQVLGTPAYMAPEQAEGRLDLVGPWTDIFGLGAILYEILSGEPPFTGATLNEVLTKTIRGEVVPPHVHWPEAPAGLQAACLKALAKAPADRYQTALELGQEIQGWQDRLRRQAEDELRQAHDRLRRQQEALVALTRAESFAGPDLEAVFRRLVETAARTLGVERASIWRFTADRRAIRCDALYELSAGRHSAGAELNADAYPNYFAALAATDVIAAEDARSDPRTREFTKDYLTPLGIGAMMEVPVHPGAILCHEHVGPPRKWLPDEQMFGIAVGHLAAHAISQWERRQALEQLELARDAAATVKRSPKRWHS
jgi:serine/threonine protein kinase